MPRRTTLVPQLLIVACITGATIAHYVQLSLEHRHLTQITQLVISNVLSGKKLIQNATDMDLSHNNISSIDSDVILLFKQLRDFTMNDNRNYEFPANREFLLNTGITRVSLQHCGIRQIHDLTFKRMAKLNTLLLEGNRIEKISQNAFQHNKNLQCLNLSHNRLKQFNQHGRLLHLPNLLTLQMNFNPEFSLAANEVHSKYLLRFECNGCANQRLSKEIMHRLPYLARVLLDYNGIENLPFDTFQTNKFLKHLTLSGNPLTTVRFESGSIRNLVCRNCTGLNELDARSFEGVGNVEVVDLTDSRIKVIANDAFKSLPDLKHLYLENNDLQEFAPEIIQTMETLCLGGNDFRPSYQNSLMTLAYRSRSFLQNNCDKNDDFEHRLANVTIASGKVLSLPKKGNTFAERITTVDLSNNGIVYIENSYFSAKHPDMTRLFMDDNVEYAFPLEAPFIEHTHLETFSCQRCNTLVIYAATFQELPNLKTLNLNRTGLHTIALAAFVGNGNLHSLLIENNQIKAFPREIVETIPKLLELSMSGNRDFQVQERRIFLYHDRLQRFNCNDCGFRRIDGDTFSRLPDLAHLELERNQISEIASDVFGNNAKLRSVNLNGNNFKRIPTDIVLKLPHLSQLCLESNPSYEFVRTDDDGVLRENILDKKLNVDCGCLSNCFLDNLPIVATTTTSTTSKRTSTTVEPNTNSYTKEIAQRFDEEMAEAPQEQVDLAGFDLHRESKDKVESKPMRMVQAQSEDRSNGCSLNEVGYFFWVLTGIVQILYLK